MEIKGLKQEITQLKRTLNNYNKVPDGQTSLNLEEVAECS